MSLATIDRNQGNIPRHGIWLWRRNLAFDEAADVAAAARHALFSIPATCRILGFITEVVTTDTGTSLTADINLENVGGDVQLDAAIALDAASGTKYQMDVADAGIESIHTASAPIELVLDIQTSTAPVQDGVFTFGLYVARIDYDL